MTSGSLRSSWSATVSESETGVNESRAVWKIFMVIMAERCLVGVVGLVGLYVVLGLMR